MSAFHPNRDVAAGWRASELLPLQFRAFTSRTHGPIEAAEYRVKALRAGRLCGTARLRPRLLVRWRS